MKRWQLLILIFELVLFAAILVLPQVALPDLAFHEGTAPVAAHSRVCDHAPGNGDYDCAALIAALRRPIVQCAARLRMFRPRRSVHSRLSSCAF